MNCMLVAISGQCSFPRFEEPAMTEIIDGIAPEKRAQALSLIRLYCNRPYRDHGKKRTDGPDKGWHLHDWGHVVQRGHRMFFDMPLDIPSATIAAKPVRA